MRECGWCKNAFVPVDAAQTFCSRTHARKAYQRRRDEETRPVREARRAALLTPRECLWCGTAFTPVQDPRQTFCCREHKHKARSERKDSCVRYLFKVRYPSWEDAAARAVTVILAGLDEPDRGYLLPYQCDHCPSFHVGHRMDGTRDALTEELRRLERYAEESGTPIPVTAEPDWPPWAVGTP